MGQFTKDEKLGMSLQGFRQTTKDGKAYRISSCELFSRFRLSGRAL